MIDDAAGVGFRGRCEGLALELAAEFHIGPYPIALKLSAH